MGTWLLRINTTFSSILCRWVWPLEQVLANQVWAAVSCLLQVHPLKRKLLPLFLSLPLCWLEYGHIWWAILNHTAHILFFTSRLELTLWCLVRNQKCKPKGKYSRVWNGLKIWLSVFSENKHIHLAYLILWGVWDFLNLWAISTLSFYLFTVDCVGSGLTCPVARGILVPWPGIRPAPPALEGLFFTTGSPTLYLSIYEGHFSCFHVFMATHTWTPYLHALNNNMHPNFRNADVEKNYACRKTFHPVSVRKNLTIQSEYLRLRISASPPDNSVMSHTWRYSRDLMKHEAS